MKFHDVEQLKPIEARKGVPLLVDVEWDFRPDVRDFRDSDWSVTVWGADGDVFIEHTKAGVESEHWPLIPRQAGEI